MAAIRQVRLKGVPIPILELKLQDVGEDLVISLWRESALSIVAVVDWVRVSNLRKPTNRFRHNDVRSHLDHQISNCGPWTLTGTQETTGLSMKKKM